MALPLKYNLRNLLVRKLSNGLTFAVVAIVVAVLCILLSFAAGIRASLAASGSPLNIIVLKPGATAESTSFLLTDEAAWLTQTPGVETGPDGGFLVSKELCVQTSIPRRTSDRALANVAVRGIDDVAFDVHTNVRLIEGRRPSPGQMELVVGKAARDRFEGLVLGDELMMGRSSNRGFKVVGVFESGGGALESEIWAPRSAVADAYGRTYVSSAALRMKDAAAVQEGAKYLRSPAVGLDPRTEVEYYRELAAKTKEIVFLATVLVSIMSIGAVFAVANTLYAAVDSRRREIAMLRTIGFSRGPIIVSFVIESLIVCVAACLCGIGLSLFFSGARQDFLSDTTWTVLAYELRLTPAIVGTALGVSTMVGVVGALAPALRASRVAVIEALRKA